jgi:carbohydrate-binding DOMON domain-containing protein
MNFLGGSTMKKFLWIAVMFCFVFAAASGAQEISFSDPQGDDNGPGNYTYPTDTAYSRGSFDLTGFKMKASGGQADFEVSVGSKLEDPWRMGTGFAVQMIFIFIDTDHKEGSGFTKGLPGTNIQFAPADAWDRCVILSPQSAARVKQEVDSKAGDMAAAVLIPKTTKGVGSRIIGSVPLKDLGEGDPNTWGFQVVMQSNEGYPTATDLLTRKVNEYEGQHRFGGGNDAECDPHVMDILGDDQKQQLAYECNADGTSKSMATLHMVRK